LQTDIAWKAAAGLALTDEAFHPTVLTLWRNKLRASKSPQRIFDAVRAVIAESGVIAGKNRRALDSTVLDDAVARQDTVTMLVDQIRRVRKLVPELASVWVREHNYDGGRPPCDWADPADRDRLVSELVDDANELVWAAEDLELDPVQADAVALLALVAGQDVEPGDGPGQWRIARRTAPDRVISTVDPDARHAHKTRRAYRDGYKAHIAAEPDTGLITACDIGAGNAGDTDAAPDLIATEPAGTEVLGDSAYSAGQFRAHLAERNMKPALRICGWCSGLTWVFGGVGQGLQNRRLLHQSSLRSPCGDQRYAHVRAACRVARREGDRCRRRRWPAVAGARRDHRRDRRVRRLWDSGVVEGAPPGRAGRPRRVRPSCGAGVAQAPLVLPRTVVRCGHVHRNAAGDRASACWGD
jgi:hypothetical protein